MLPPMLQHGGGVVTDRRKAVAKAKADQLMPTDHEQIQLQTPRHRGTSNNGGYTRTFGCPLTDTCISLRASQLLQLCVHAI